MTHQFTCQKIYKPLKECTCQWTITFPADVYEPAVCLCILLNHTASSCMQNWNPNMCTLFSHNRFMALTPLVPSEMTCLSGMTFCTDIWRTSCHWRIIKFSQTIGGWANKFGKMSRSPWVICQWQLIWWL